MARRTHPGLNGEPCEVPDHPLTWRDWRAIAGNVALLLVLIVEICWLVALAGPRP
jgi:hypothetical protein